MLKLSKIFLLLILFVGPFSIGFFFGESPVLNEVWGNPAIPTQEDATSQDTSPASSVSSPQVIEIKGHCEWTDFGSFFAGCLTDKIIYFSGILFVLGATVFDFFLQLTLSNGILEQPYISTAWVSMRDLANITFIFGIIAVAFMMITGMMGDWRKVAWKLIIVALLLNFSLFFTRVVIDAGNILGGFFYNQIIAGAPEAYVKGVNGEEVKSPGAKLISSLSVDQIMGETAIQQMTDGSSNPNSFWFTFNVAVLAMSFLMAKSLFKVGFFMLSRTVWLVIYSIISPLAFVAYFIPSAGSYARDWFQGLVNKSFCVCAYLFILYLTFVLVKGITLGSSAYAGDGNATWINLLIQMAITVGLVATLMDKGTSIAQKMCEGGSGGIGSTVMKTAVGAAALVGGGAAGVAARGTLGRAGYNMTRQGNDLAGSTKASRRLLGNAMLYAGRGLEKAPFGTKQGYRAKLDAGADAAINTGQNIYNVQKGKEMDRQKADIDSGKISKQAATKIAEEKAAQAQSAYHEGISKKFSIGGIGDYMLAGAVASGSEAKKRHEKVKGQEELAQFKQNALAAIQKVIAQKVTREDKALKRTMDNLSRSLGILTVSSNGEKSIAEDDKTQELLGKFEDSLAYSFRTRSVDSDGSVKDADLTESQKKQVEDITSVLESQLEEERVFHKEALDRIEDIYQKEASSGDASRIQAASIIRQRSVDEQNKDYNKRKEGVLKDAMQHGTEQLKAWQSYEKQAIPAKLENIFEERNFAIEQFEDNLTQDVNPILTNQS